MNSYDVIIVGAGHAGIEAALASSRMGSKTLMLTFNKDNIGLMSCNPAIGGVGKGQLVKEIDALGGQMGRSADICGIQFRILNASKGAAVWSSRAQIDMYQYNQLMKETVLSQGNLSVKEAEARKLIVLSNKIRGVITEKDEEILADCVVLCPGTFLDGLMHVGLNKSSGGRIEEPASIGLADNLNSLGVNLLRFKTGTCPRLDKDSIDFRELKTQDGDNPACPFSFSTEKITQQQVPCYITYTNPLTHKIILDNLDRSPLYSGVIKATGVRYCPSIEDKIVKFPERVRHQIFLEPQGRNSSEIYPNGLSTSFPEDVQLQIVHSIDGLNEAKIIRFGYGIEHTVIDSTQLYPSLESKLINNLYFAGQINGTTGYEEAAAQGLIAGINASLCSRNKEPFILDRSTSYIGTLIDDLTTKGTNEPYRMFTSRVEYRLILREDNADIRLMKLGYELGLIEGKQYLQTQKKAESIQEGISFLKNTRIKPSEDINNELEKLNTTPIKKPTLLEDILKRPQINIAGLRKICKTEFSIPDFALSEVEIEVKYDGFIQRQLKEVERFRNLEKIRIPEELDYSLINGISREIKEKLAKFKPLNLGQASRISGVTPAAISLLMVYLKKIRA